MNNMQLTIESSTTSMDLNDHQTGIYLVPELDGMTGLPEIRTSSGVNAGYDGGWTSAQNYDARLITIRGVIAHPVVSTVETIRRQLVSLVGQGRKEALTLRLTTEAGNVYTVFVRTIACTMALQRVLTSQEFQIQFRADDPLIYDDGASSGTAGILRVQRALGGFEINFNLPLFIGGGSTGTPIENGGSETVYPIINLYGPLHSPTVINSTTNQQMQILADLAYEDNWQTPATASGSAFQITGIEGAPLTLTELKGNAKQDGTPTPDNPQPISVVTGENTVKITGKNLINENGERSSQYIDNAGNFVSGVANGYVNQQLPTKPNTAYTFSASSKTTQQVYIRIGEYRADGSFIKRNLITSLEQTITTDAECYIIKTCIDVSGGNHFTKPQLELGSTATAYEPYQGQSHTIDLGSIELAKIGNYQDRIYKNDGKWYIEKQVGKVTLNGSEDDWSFQSSNAPFRYRLTGAYATYDDASTYISDYFQSVSWNATWTDYEYLVSLNSRNSILAFRYTGISTLDAFKTWLSTHPTTVYYALATPTTTEITNTTLLSQLNFIANLYGGTNNITLVGTGAQGEIGVEYMTENDIRRDVAVVDSQARTITINGSDAYHLKADGSEFITIAPGTNDMSLTSAQTSDEGYAEIKYKQGYLSI